MPSAIRYEYRVLSQKDRWFLGRVDPDKLADALNELARDGWRVCSAANSPFHGLIRGDRDELLIILEREAADVAPTSRAQKEQTLPSTSPCPHCGGEIDSRATRCVHCMKAVKRLP